MRNFFEPGDWYWIADDGRLFSSRRGRTIDAEDEAFSTFVSTIGPPSRWPEDAAGNQTDAALTAALAPYGVEISLIAYAEQKRWEKETGGIVVNGISIATDDRGKQMLLGARVAAITDAQFTTSWVAQDGSIHEVDFAIITALSNAVLLHVRECFATYADVKAAIEDGSIDSTGQIDQAFL